MREIKILAHRTGMGRFPPNSLVGLRGCWADGVFGFECDVSFLSPQEEPFIWVKEMRRILQSPGAVLEKMTSREIAWLGRTDCGEKVLRLNDVFDFLEQYPLQAYFDVKYYGLDLFGQLCPISRHLQDLAVRKIMRPALERKLADRISFVTFGGGWELLQLAKTVDARIGTNLMIGLPWLTIDDRHFDYLDAVTIGWKGINPWRWPWCAGRLDRLLETARGHGLKVYGGLADTKKEIEWLVSKNFDGIWSNDVPLVRDILKNKKEEK
ncbi:MAG: hypothetical protein A3C71_02975 [Candidatus Yanofskybacteria bacterium RIFCSPHIGHO2_02_FULL_43_15c]|uniref:GP-PDE domain-containing protein n=2 Tax=Candidatus Yanofskyibacteriota TaxID=1752733 RepID=A0A1F8H5E1_9BACT|nr:MAG: hypothetical protein A3C71_02975 [Candidatus Yanofskybacteria bacterium RIFCSPHIGHO2_02_FULL_43_15c]OGN32069.1 MAG: hypothetical protein A3I92_00045 [Candidatus Yanofskybacteria bacterium RIFCSPLOWO2_02_FULL_43_10b]